MKIKNGILLSVEPSDIVHNTLIIPNGVTTISSNIFNDHFDIMSYLEEVRMPSTLRVIEDSAFRTCSMLKNVYLNEDLEKIGDFAFHFCTRLENIVLPENIKTLGENCFSNCKSLTSIIIPKSVETISKNLFYNCQNLESVVIEEGVKNIEQEAFQNCTLLNTISLPESIENLGASAFSCCRNLKSIKLPSKLKTIPKESFINCSSLNQVILPTNLENIGDSSFENCSNLTDIVIPSTVKRIYPEAFQSCKSLKNITLPDELMELGNSVFRNCMALSKINIPKNIKTIPTHAFLQCTNLQTVTLPENLEKIDEAGFSNCISLKNIELPENLKIINSYAFCNCKSLEEIFIPNSVEILESNTFSLCDSLKKVHLPENITTLEFELFKYCVSLEEITIPAKVDTIRNDAFCSCISLKNIKLPNNIHNLSSMAFRDCKSLKELHIPSSIKEFNCAFLPFSFFNKDEDGFTLSKEERENSLNLTKDVSFSFNLPFLSNYWKYKDIILNESKSKYNRNFYTFFLSKLPDKKIVEFLENHNLTFFKQFNVNCSFMVDQAFTKLLYNLGGFLPAYNENGKVIDYSQKVSTFLLDKIDKKQLRIEESFYLFDKMTLKGFNKEFTDFFMQNFDELMKVENSSNQRGFIAKCYNSFEEVQASNTSNRGNQRQLKPTIQKFLAYFKENKFIGVTEETQSLSDTIYPFFDNQDAFDNAVRIFNEKKENNIPDNILQSSLSESTMFDYINKISKKIEDLRISTIQELVNTAENEFTFEWLSKNDPQNLILGKLCSCCSHLEGAGYGIMHASIVHPNVQNLVIRDKNGKIVAKSTLFINPREGYGVFNNVEVSGNIPVYEREKIYQKFILGINTFAEIYNKEHKDNPLKQINVGMNLNDISIPILKNNKKSETILKSLNYAQYGIDGKTYNGDSSYEQYIVWENEKLQNENISNSQENEKQ